MKDSLGDRIKRYEDTFRIKIPRKMPLIVRLDGVAFRIYTKGLVKPDQNLIDCMDQTATYLCKNIQGVKLSYVQSDEISLLIYDNDFESQPWFDNNLQKIVSVSAAKASAYFSSISDKIFGKTKLAAFDARAFIVPLDEVTNSFIFRQQDATRNSLQMLAQSFFSPKELLGKKSTDLYEMCWKKGVNWNDLPTSQKRGRCVVKIQSKKEAINSKTKEKIIILRSDWTVDNNIPIFSSGNRNYIEKYLENEIKDK